VIINGNNAYTLYKSLLKDYLQSQIMTKYRTSLLQMHCHL
jgi:hypothetical protein